MSNKLIKVYSHPRSGTNFIEALIMKNFFTDVDVSTPGTSGWGHWSENYKFDKPILHGKLFGSHRMQTKGRWPGLYIYRDARDVALSVWRSKGFLHTNIKDNNTFSTYLKTNLDWQDTPSLRAIPTKNIFKHWLDHVTGWHEKYKGSNILFVRFEELLIDTDNVLIRIGEHFDLERQAKVLSLKKMVGPSPNAGKCGKWKEFFSPEDLKFFFSIVPKDCPYLWNK